ncbi:probable Xaa-Pro aminopeptidase 3 isoform X2 [Anoplophora glabripennis]|uniref:probable Xaa-Pro aminopeptidase 3 isoform X2 n=1 Tax=Anoplophora glabripennis TaxID=217634 RepID=UPI0008744424|nr:probable Xaa-Pro aminopeptidase 3 isoform X2 [Anoplophora glabripennis]
MFIKSVKSLTSFKADLTLRKLCMNTMNAPKSKRCDSNFKRNFGQPSFNTHPHLIKEGEVTPFITKSEYQDRRCNLVECILKHAATNNKEKSHVIVIPAASKQYMSDKIPYVFRQNTEFLYLTGCQEPDCCVVITAESSGQLCTTFFTRDKDEHAELWDGPRTHPEQATDFFGVEQSLPISELDNFLKSYRKSNKNLMLWYDFLTPVQNSVHKVISDYISDSRNQKCDNPKSFIHRLRLYKSPAEIALMQKSCDITAKAFKEAMSSSKPCLGENQIFAEIDYRCRMQGAEYLAYPPVVAGGSRATIIHYINNNQLINDGEMVLVDAGCEYHGYSSDVTRTWPVNGKFTPQQREIYEVVYSVQEELIQMCSSLPTLDALFESMCYLLGKRLQEIGLIGIQPSSEYLMKVFMYVKRINHYPKSTKALE